MGRYRAVCCDLLTALLDSWSLWESVAGDAASGTRWRLASIELVTRARSYRPYDAVVMEAAGATGLDPK
ncbi:MAG: haloacid dehalogenase, partial [Solirubrobacteraceae bacterium]